MGLVRSGKGHGGGWRLARGLQAVTLRDIYDELGAPQVFAIGHKTENPVCLVEQAVNTALTDALHEAKACSCDGWVMSRWQRFTSTSTASCRREAYKRGPPSMLHDVIIIGGSYSGMAAAL